PFVSSYLSAKFPLISLNRIIGNVVGVQDFEPRRFMEHPSSSFLRRQKPYTPQFVIPAEAGIQYPRDFLDCRFLGNDIVGVQDFEPLRLKKHLISWAVTVTGETPVLPIGFLLFLPVGFLFLPVGFLFSYFYLFFMKLLTLSSSLNYSN
ncbi:MAG: hypothetical protein ACK4Z9_08240, partial [Thermodesulfovibrionales bacterium]